MLDAITDSHNDMSPDITFSIVNYVVKVLGHMQILRLLGGKKYIYFDIVMLSAELIAYVKTNT